MTELIVNFANFLTKLLSFFALHVADAFQHAPRDEMLSMLFTHDEMRDFIPLFLNLYDGDAELFFGDLSTLLSSEGCLRDARAAMPVLGKGHESGRHENRRCKN
eukprot:COSAG01_NODE_10250_length_2209_cov_13.398578_1_plen_104_part_00